MPIHGFAMGQEGDRVRKILARSGPSQGSVGQVGPQGHLQQGGRARVPRVADDGDLRGRGHGAVQG